MTAVASVLTADRYEADSYRKVSDIMRTCV